MSIDNQEIISEQSSKPSGEIKSQQSPALGVQPAASSSTEPRRERTPAKPKRRTGWFVLAGLVLLAGSFAGGALFYRHYQATKQVIAAVNGTIVNEQELFNRMEKASGTDTMRELVTEEIQIAYAKDRGVMPNNDVVRQAVQAAMSDPTFAHQVADSEEDLQDYFRQVQVNLAKAAVVTQGITVSEADIKAYYNDNIRHDNPHARFYVPPTTTLQVIRNHSQAAIEAADRDLRNGRDYAAVVSDYSTDPSKEHEGITAPLIKGRNNMAKIPGMEETVFGVDLGEKLGPKQYAGDWWIFKCINKTPQTTVPYERAHIEAEIGAKMAKVTPQRLSAVQEDFERFQKGVNVQVFWPKYKESLIVR